MVPEAAFSEEAVEAAAEAWDWETAATEEADTGGTVCENNSLLLMALTTMTATMTTRTQSVIIKALLFFNGIPPFHRI